MNPRFASAAAAILCLAGFLGAPEAGAGSEIYRVVVMSFEGPGGKAVRNSLIKELSDVEGIDLISRKKATETAESLGIPADSSKPKNLVKIGEVLGLDAIVTGEVYSEKKLKNLEIMVIFTEKPSVSFTKNYTWKGKAPPKDLIKEIGADVVHGILTTIDMIQAEKAKPVYVPPPPTGEKPKKPKKERPAKDERGAVISVQAGMMMSARKLKILSATNPDIDYDGSAYPAIAVDLDFFPIRLATTSPASGLGLSIDFRRSFLLESKLQATTDAYKTALTALDIRLAYQLILAKAPLTIDFTAGWGMFYYSIENASRDGLPVVSFEYMNILLGAIFGITAVDPWLTIDVGGTVRIPFSWGEAAPAYGGKGSGIGGTVILGLRGDIAVGLFWSAGFEYTGFSTTHEGDCEATSGTCLTAEKSKDNHISGWAKIGFAW